MPRDATVLKIGGLMMKIRIGIPTEWDSTLEQDFWGSVGRRGSQYPTEFRSPAMVGGGMREPRQRATLRPWSAGSHKTTSMETRMRRAYFTFCTNLSGTDFHSNHSGK